MIGGKTSRINPSRLVTKADEVNGTNKLSGLSLWK